MENKFIDGLFVHQPNEKAPDWVVGNLSFNATKFTKYLADNRDEKGWVNVDLLRSKAGELYAKKNEWKPTKVESNGASEQTEPTIEDVPF